MRLSIIATTILLTSIAVLPLPARAGASTLAPAAPPAPSGIETDPKTGAVLFIVNGKEQARIDATGLHVRENVSYEGTLTDGDLLYLSAAPDAHKGKGKP